jgi:hypothetical protein
MRSKSLIILAGIVVALGAFIYFSERHMPTTDEREQQADRVFPGLERDDVESVEIHNSHGVFRLVKDDASWRLVEPIDFPADQTAVSSLLGSLERLEAERTLAADEVDPSAYGLEDPSLSVTLGVAGSESLTLSVGDEAALGSNRAMRRGNEPAVILAAGWITTDLDKDLDGWRSREVIDLTANDVASLQIVAGEDRIQVVRQDDGWRLLEPIEDAADGEHVRNLISDLDALRVAEFLDQPPPPAELGLEPPSYQLTIVRSEGGDPIRLDFGATRTEDGRTEVACRRDSRDLLWVDDRAATRLAKAPVRWRASNVAEFDSWDAERLSISSDDGSVSLERREGLWSDPDEGGEVDYSAVQDRLSALAGLEAVEFDLIEPATPPAGTVELAFEADDDGEPRELVLTFHRPLTEGGDALVRSSDRPTVMSVDAAEVDRILTDPESLIRPASEPKDEVTSTDEE